MQQESVLESVTLDFSFLGFPSTNQGKTDKREEQSPQGAHACECKLPGVDTVVFGPDLLNHQLLGMWAADSSQLLPFTVCCPGSQLTISSKARTPPGRGSQLMTHWCRDTKFWFHGTNLGRVRCHLNSRTPVRISGGFSRNHMRRQLLPLPTPSSSLLYWGTPLQTCMPLSISVCFQRNQYFPQALCPSSEPVMIEGWEGRI